MEEKSILKDRIKRDLKDLNLEENILNLSITIIENLAITVPKMLGDNLDNNMLYCHGYIAGCCSIIAGLSGSSSFEYSKLQIKMSNIISALLKEKLGGNKYEFANFQIKN